MADFVKVAETRDIPAGEMKLVEVHGESIVIANLDGEFYAFNNSCPHAAGPLADGYLEDDVVECPYHGSQFNVKTGEYISGPASSPMQTYQVQVEGSDIKVSVE